MTDEQKAAYIHAQSICALAEIQGMIATNDRRKQLDLSVAYDEEAFLGVPGRYGLHHNQVCETFHE